MTFWGAGFCSAPCFYDAVNNLFTISTRNNIQNIPLFILSYKNKFCPVRLLTNYFKKTIVISNVSVKCNEQDMTIRITAFRKPSAVRDGSKARLALTCQQLR